eukprot:332879_1
MQPQVWIVGLVCCLLLYVLIEYYSYGDFFYQPSNSDTNASIKMYVHKSIKKAHIKQLPSYYPTKSKLLFAKYITTNHVCDFTVIPRDHHNISTNTYFTIQQTKRYGSSGTTTENYSIDFTSFYCEVLLSLKGNYFWKISFYITELQKYSPANTIPEFELFVTANVALNTSYSIELRSTGRVASKPTTKTKYNQTHNLNKYLSHFYIFYPNIQYQIDVIYSHINIDYDYTKESQFGIDIYNIIKTDILSKNKSLNIANMNEEIIYNAIKKSEQYKHINITKLKYDIKSVAFDGSYIQNGVPFHFIVKTSKHIHINYDNMLNIPYCYMKQFHFDKYQNIPILNTIKIKINYYNIKKYPIDKNNIFTMDRRIGRWIF